MWGGEGKMASEKRLYFVHFVIMMSMTIKYDNNEAGNEKMSKDSHI